MKPFINYNRKKTNSPTKNGKVYIKKIYYIFYGGGIQQNGVFLKIVNAFFLFQRRRKQQGKAWQGKAWHGEAWQGMAWYCMEVQNMKISVKIKGTTPLLMNRFRDAEIEGKSKKSKGEQKERVLEDKLYLTEGNKPYIPAVYFLRCLTDAGKRLQVRGKGKSTYSKLVGSTVIIEPDAIVLNGKYSEFRTSAVNPVTKGRMIISRPMFKDWGCEFEIVLSDESISFSTMNELLVDAGKYTGVGDWRPEKKGMYGKFLVVSFQELK